MKPPANRIRITRDGEEVIDIVREVIIKHYGQLTWIMLEKHIRSKNVDKDSIEELLEAIKEFFGGSEEIINVILSRYDSINTESDEFSLEN